MSDDRQIEEQIRNEYKNRFGTDLRNVRLHLANIGGGSLAIAEYMAGDQRIEDIVFVDPNGKPEVFEKTGDLIRYIDLVYRKRWIDYVFHTKLFTGVIFVGLLIALVWIGTFSEERYDSRVIAIIGSVIGLAAAMFFSSDKARF